MSQELDMKPPAIRLKIRTDGTFAGTRITDEDGRPLVFNSIHFDVNVNSHAANVMLEIPNVEVDFRTKGTADGI